AKAGSEWHHSVTTGATIHVVLSGTISEVSPTGASELSPASLAVRVPASSASTFRAGSSGARIVSIDYAPAALVRLTPCDRALATSATFKGRSSVELAWRILGELHAPDPLTPATLRIFVDGIAIGCSRFLLRKHHANVPALAAAARRILEKEFRRPPTLARLAKQLGCTPAHLARTFRAAFGFTVRGWIEARRVEEGKRLLSSSRQSIGGIADALGFADQAHFARAFRRATSVSPREFRSAANDINPILK
ncbi:MAG: AraC family transcriptional regulator, partial [Gemmatimonadota bacterium]